MRNIVRASALAFSMVVSASGAQAQFGYPGAPPIDPSIYQNSAPPMGMGWGFRSQEGAWLQGEAFAQAVFQYCLTHPCRADARSMWEAIQEANKAGQSYIEGMQQNSQRTNNANENWVNQAIRNCTLYRDIYGQIVCVPNY